MKINLTNGVSFGAVITVTEQMVSDTKVTVEFVGASDEPVFYDLAFSVMILRAGVVQGGGTLTVTGSTLEIADGGDYTLTANDVIHIIAQRAIVVE